MQRINISRAGGSKTRWIMSANRSGNESGRCRTLGACEAIEISLLPAPSSTTASARSDRRPSQTAASRLELPLLTVVRTRRSTTESVKDPAENGSHSSNSPRTALFAARSRSTCATQARSSAIFPRAARRICSASAYPFRAVNCTKSSRTSKIQSGLRLRQY